MHLGNQLLVFTFNFYVNNLSKPSPDGRKPFYVKCLQPMINATDSGNIEGEKI